MGLVFVNFAVSTFTQDILVLAAVYMYFCYSIEYIHTHTLPLLTSLRQASRLLLLLILLPQPPRCWGSKCVPPCLSRTEALDRFQPQAPLPWACNLHHWTLPASGKGLLITGVHFYMIMVNSRYCKTKIAVSWIVHVGESANLIKAI